MAEEKKKLHLKKEEIEKLVSLYEEEKKKKKSKKISNDFEVSKIRETYVERVKLREKVFYLSIARQSSASFIVFIQSLSIVFNYLLSAARATVDSEDDYVRFIFSHAPDRYFSTCVLPLKEFSVEYFMNSFEKHMQSNKSLTANGWSTEVTIQTFPHGISKNNKKNKINNISKKKHYRFLGNVDNDSGGVNKTIQKYGRLFRNGVFYVICNKLNQIVKNCCFVVSLLVALSFLKKDEKSSKMEREPHRDCSDLFTSEQICNVYQKCGISVGNVKTEDMVKVYSCFLEGQGVDLVVYSDNFDNNIIYDSRTDENGDLIKLTNDVVCLWLNNKHYDVILSMRKFSKLSNFCVKCMSHFGKYEHEDNHICNIKLTCQKCYRQTNCTRINENNNNNIECDKCGILFNDFECFSAHLVNRIFKPIQSNYGKLTPCQYLFFCEICDKICPRFIFYTKTKVKKHNCNKSFCYHCKSYKKKDHYCYMKPSKIRPEDNELFFFDFETRVDENKLMIPFYCIVQKVCKKCENIEFKKGEKNEVECCGIREFIFEETNGGEPVVDMLCEFIILQENSVWIAHNGGRFDTVFIFKFLLEKKKICPQSIMCGNKIMKLFIEGKNISFFDSYSFLHMGLAKIPKAMGIPDLCKGYHPYFFYDLNYVGELIDKKYFDVDNMSEEKKNDFEKWYLEKSKLENYNFREEMYYYCCSDVEILRRGCVKFSQLFGETANINPFYDSSCITIASLALKIFRYNFLREKCVGIIPAGGYRGRVNQSMIALNWLNEINNEIGGGLEYKCSRTGEKKILNRFVDGFFNGVVYQFHGCFYHGCPVCYHLYDYNPVLNEKYCNLYSRTKKFTYRLKSAGYKVIEKWECEYLKEKKFSKTEMCEMKRNFYAYIPLEPRDSLYGGRTSPVCLYKNVEENEKIFYIDFTSLYPYVQKTNKFPTGHPKIYVKEECDGLNIKNLFGLIKCKILPPQNLYFAVLPVRCDGKLLFPLCNLCASTTNLNECNHNEDERCLMGTWTTVEVNKAIEYGYQIYEIYEIYHFTRQEKFFSEYVNCFLKIKQEASGYTPECYDDGILSDEKIDKYIKDYHYNEGILLEKENIKHNPGLRTIAKDILNSLWGKFAQNENNTKVEFLSEYDELLNLANDKNIELTSVDFINETITRVTYKKKEEITVSLKTGNVIVASFVTSYARLELFNLIDRLQKKVLYFDTDSVIYSCMEGEEAVKTGNYLGELTNELDTDEWITQFCSTGPKSYSYITNLNNEIVHIKGFSLNNKDVKEKLNFISLKACLENKNQMIEIKYKDKITRNKLNYVFKQDETKIFSFTFNKRIVKNDFYSTPYGFLD